MSIKALDEDNLLTVIKYTDCSTFLKIPFVSKRCKSLINKVECLPKPSHRNELARIDVLRMLKRVEGKENIGVVLNNETLAILDDSVISKLNRIHLLFDSIPNPIVMKKYSKQIENIVYCGNLDYSKTKTLFIKCTDLWSNEELLKTLKECERMYISIDWENESILKKIKEIPPIITPSTIKYIIVHNITSVSQFQNVTDFITSINNESNTQHMFNYSTYVSKVPFPVNINDLETTFNYVEESHENENGIFDGHSKAKSILLKKGLKYADKQLDWKNQELPDIMPMNVTVCGISPHAGVDLSKSTYITSVTYDVYSDADVKPLILPLKLKTLEITQTFPIWDTIPNSVTSLALGESPSKRPRAEKRKLVLNKKTLKIISKMKLKVLKMNTVECTGKLRLKKLDALEIRSMNTDFIIKCHSLKKLSLVESEVQIVIKSKSNVLEELETDFVHVRVFAKNLSETHSLKIIDCPWSLISLEYFKSPVVVLRKVDASEVKLNNDFVKYLSIEGCHNLSNNSLPSIEDLKNIISVSVQGCDQLRSLRQCSVNSKK